jgi:hypothetical protein
MLPCGECFERFKAGIFSVSSAGIVPRSAVIDADDAIVSSILDNSQGLGVVETIETIPAVFFDE